ncbi:hypothetical protein J1N35_046009 [Gossypium stocksii]|uniref:SWIM-type domain-containing protein n=1 Tax=Gossypium stocksii TaxID=47602 RepID=A0A9D3UCA1_9ROSI|nr:hypothetical protein J1N35_046009 [Gossypium stocksii]
MIALYYRDRSCQTNLIQLFIELADLEPAEDSIPLSEERGVQDPCTVVPRAYVDKRSTVRDINIDLNVPLAFENHNPGPHLQIHSVVIDIDVDGDHGYDNNGYSRHEVEDYSDSDLNDVSDDIDDKGTNDDRNVKTASVDNTSRGIVIHNDLRAHIFVIDPDTTHAFEFLEYPDILLIHQLVVDSEQKELFVGQKFVVNEDYVLQAGKLDAKNGVETSQPNGSGIGVCRRCQEGNGCELSEIKFIECRAGIPPRSNEIDLQNRRCDCGKFQSLRYPCAYVVVACVYTSINVEQYIDEVYNLKRTLRVWGNKFPVLRDLST